MKKIISIAVICLLMFLCLAACTHNDPAEGSVEISDNDVSAQESVPVSSEEPEDEPGEDDSSHCELEPVSEDSSEDESSEDESSTDESSKEETSAESSLRPAPEVSRDDYDPNVSVYNPWEVSRG